MKEIYLTQGKVTIVDDEDFDDLNQWNWYYGSDGYAKRSNNSINGSKDIFMHRVVANTPDDLITDHIDGNKLNNTKSNLRHCTNQQNQWNQKPREDCSSKYKGVTKRKNNYEVSFMFEGKVKYFGKYDNEIAAANAYNFYAKEYRGEFANLNEITFMDKTTWMSHKVKIKKTSKYVGVYWSKKVNRWEASCKHSGKQKFIGYFNSEKEAVEKRNDYIREHNLSLDIQ